MSTQTMVLGAVLTALVVILQFMGAFIRFGPFSISLVLIPIVIGAATCGVAIGAWLGFIFGIVVLISGDAAAFMAINVPGTIVTVLLKGILCGLCAGLVYKYVTSALNKRSAKQMARIGVCGDCEPKVLAYISRNNKYIAVLAAAIVCPVVNTGIFLVGCFVFFLDTVASWAGEAHVIYYMIFGLVGGNFLFEVASNLLLSPVVVRLLNIRKK